MLKLNMIRKDNMNCVLRLNAIRIVHDNLMLELDGLKKFMRNL
jgi:hypothetical protein